MLLGFRKIKNSSGFTLIEVLIVASISVFVSINLLTNFLRSKANLAETARTFIADIRNAQANALASRQYISPTGAATHRCGYGIHPIDGSSYITYVGRVFGASGSCPNDYQFGNSTDTPILKTGVLDVQTEFFDPNGNPPPDFFYDVFFEPPDAYIWIGNQHILTGANPRTKSEIIIRRKGATCPSVNCVYVCVYASGRIEQRSTQCPNV